MRLALLAVLVLVGCGPVTPAGPPGAPCLLRDAQGNSVNVPVCWTASTVLHCVSNDGLGVRGVWEEVPAPSAAQCQCPDAPGHACQ